MGSEDNNFLKGEIGTEADKGKHCNAKAILKGRSLFTSEKSSFGLMNTENRHFLGSTTF